MHVRELRIGGQASYEIVEEIEHPTRTEYRVVASLGSEAEPENARRRRHATLISLERSLQRLEPLRDADPKIARKCDTLHHRIEREKQKIAQLTDAIESLAAAPARATEEPDRPGNFGSLKLISTGADPSAAPESSE